MEKVKNSKVIDKLSATEVCSETEFLIKFLLKAKNSDLLNWAQKNSEKVKGCKFEIEPQSTLCVRLIDLAELRIRQIEALLRSDSESREDEDELIFLIESISELEG